MVNDRLIINGATHKVEDIPNLPQDLVAYKAAEKSNETPGLCGRSKSIL